MRYALRTACASALVALLSSSPALALPRPSWMELVASQPTAPQSDVAVVWISGDGGWGRMEREVTSRLAAAGLPTIGVSALRYFSSPRQPDVAAAEIAAAAKPWMESLGRKKIIFVGFSFGADIGPFIVKALPKSVRDQVVLAAFLSPSEKANFQVSPASWMGIGLGPPVWPEMTSLAPTKVLCVGGAGVFEDICPDGKPPPGVASVRLPGGHTLTNQYDAIAELLLKESRERQAAPSASALSRVAGQP